MKRPVRTRTGNLLIALASVVMVALAVGMGANAADDAATGPIGRAAAFAIQIRLPETPTITHAPVISRGGEARSGGGYATQPDPAIASLMTSEATTGVRSGGDAVRGDASVRLAGLTLLDGLVTADALVVQAAAGAAGDGRADGALRARIDGLVVQGRAVEASPNQVILLEGIGDLVIEESVDTTRADGAARSFVVGLHLRIRQDYRGLPAGTEILVGYADAGALVPQATPGAVDPGALEPLPDAMVDDLTPTPDPTPDPAPSTAPPSGFEATPSISADRQTQLLEGGYMFPVLGATSNDFSDDWGAPRATTGFHQGIDVFAPSGTPILAIADGTLSRVGWNTLGGKRLWLTDRYGNTFYFAHLSAFSPLAREGATVRRGDVIGFVGTTGDAVGTPPHLHFEIHPGGIGPVPPYPYVMTWLTGVPQPVGAYAVPGAEEPKPKPDKKPKPKPKPDPKPKPEPETTEQKPVVPETTAPETTTTPDEPATTQDDSVVTDILTGTGTAFGDAPADR